MTPITLVEHVTDWHAQLQIERAKRLVRNVALTGCTSKNGYRYSEQALQNAVALYEQRPVFLDHAADRSRPQERSTRDLVGSIVNPRYESGRIRGDIRVLDTDSGRTFLALAESNAPGVGMSHVVLAERSQPDGTVDRIHDVVSVDAVVFPATTRTFRESHEATATTEGAIDADDHQDPAETDASRGPADRHPHPLDERLRQLLIERDELLAKLHEQSQQRAAEQQERAIAALISEAGLPDYAVTEMFRRQLATADDVHRRQLLQERRQLIEAARRRPPLSRERSGPSDTLTSDAVFVATLRRRA